MHLAIMITNIRNHEILLCSHQSNVSELTPAVQRSFWLWIDWDIGMIRSWSPHGLPVLPCHADHKMNGMTFFPCSPTHTISTSKVV
ncbi:hypothetical protein MtrunA17_Chr4g0043031 [Medicago truncatula]|uniref:Uncharacterized protein n=1 Tax=Medicago truncatula TaxID=3880 RepID=A0A396IBA5_MEDTR|nr:hypothetical protein MtrunA17_Chr4g0043031 [Medicago truncatula]